MRKVYFLKTCSTCTRILKEVNTDDFEMQEIKTNVITKNQVEEMYGLSKSYEALFNKRAQLYKERDLKNKNLSESDYKNLILEQYTFLKRPVFIVDNEIFIGNSKKETDRLKVEIGQLL